MRLNGRTLCQGLAIEDQLELLPPPSIPAPALRTDANHIGPLYKLKMAVGIEAQFLGRK